MKEPLRFAVKKAASSRRARCVQIEETSFESVSARPPRQRELPGWKRRDRTGWKARVPGKGDKLYVRRDKEGHFKKVVEVGRSVSADKKRTAKK